MGDFNETNPPCKWTFQCHRACGMADGGI